MLPRHSLPLIGNMENRPVTLPTTVNQNTNPPGHQPMDLFPGNIYPSFLATPPNQPIDARMTAPAQFGAQTLRLQNNQIQKEGKNNTELAYQ